MHILTYKGYSPSYVRLEYGIYNAYVLPILMIPSLLISSLTTSLIPEISKNANNKLFIKKRLYQSIKLTFLISSIFYLLIFINPEIFLKLLYNTTKGTIYIRILSFVFVLYNLTGPITGVLNGLGLIKETFKIQLLSSIVKTILMVIFSFIFKGINGFIISEVIYFLVLFLYLVKLLKEKKLL